MSHMTEGREPDAHICLLEIIIRGKSDLSLPYSRHRIYIVLLYNSTFRTTESEQRFVLLSYFIIYLTNLVR